MDGFLVIDKEKEYTSRDVVNIISKKFNTNRVGHMGTLDPNATGVLVIAIGKALKLIDLLSHEKKEYIATVKLGIKTDTLDITGKIIEKEKYRDLDSDTVNNVLHSFIGKSMQEVPLYSALKVNGKRLYEYARENKNVKLPVREIEVFEIELLSINKDEFMFRTVVSKGTYIRSLIRDIGIKLGQNVTMKDLRRTKQGFFQIDNSVILDDIEKNNYRIVSMYDALKDYKIVSVDSFIEGKILNGRILENRYDDSIIVFCNSNKEILAIYEVYQKDKTKIKPIKVLK